MPKANYTHIAVVMDRSGSMQTIKNDVVQGLKHFIDEQRKVEGEATLTLARFDNEYEVIYEMTPLKDVKDIALDPRGGTALLDAMGKTMEDDRARILKMKEEDRPTKAVFVFLTDGEENSSRTYSRSRVFEMIADLQADKTIQWDVVFMGASQASIQEGNSLGVRSAATLQFAPSAGGTRAAFATLTNSMTSYRSVAKASYDFAPQKDIKSATSVNAKDEEAKEEKEPELNNKKDDKDEVSFPYFSTATNTTKK